MSENEKAEILVVPVVDVNWLVFAPFDPGRDFRIDPPKVEQSIGETRELGRQMLEAATTGGAACIGRAHDLGAIAPGMRADLVLLDLEDPSFLPLNSATRQLVYTEAGRGVRTVIVEGRIVVEDGRATMIDESELARRVEDLMPGFLEDFGRIRDRVDGMAPYLQEAHRRIWAQDIGIDRLFHEPGRGPKADA